MADQVDPLVAKAADTTAVFVNRFWISVNPETTRIIFGDAHWGTDASPRAAVAMNTSDAVSLAKLLHDLIEKNKAQRQPAPAE